MGEVVKIQERLCGEKSQLFGSFLNEARIMGEDGLRAWMVRLEGKTDKLTKTINEHHAKREREAGELTVQVRDNKEHIKDNADAIEENAKDINAMHDWKRKVDNTTETISNWKGHAKAIFYLAVAAAAGVLSRLWFT